MSRRYLLLLALAACADAADDIDLAESDALATATDSGAADGASWDVADTLHANDALYDAAGANERRVHSIWINGSTASPVTLTFTAKANEGQDVRISVLGPIVNGQRKVLGAAGYSSATRTATITLPVKTKGEHLIVVGSYNLASDTFYRLSSKCTSCAGKVDVLATPKNFALAGDAQHMVRMTLGSVMTGFGSDVAVELWASAPMQSWNAKKVATSYASGNQVNVLVPSTVKPGDDLRLVVRQGTGRILDSGVTVRYAPSPASMMRTDAVLLGDLTSIDIAGIAPFFEGQADMRLYSETRKKELSKSVVKATSPGQVGMGLNAVDLHFNPSFANAAKDGELLSVGFINGNGDYTKLGCFEYCNNLSGMSSCTGGTRACP